MMHYISGEEKLAPELSISFSETKKKGKKYFKKGEMLSSDIQALISPIYFEHDDVSF